jgi:DNA-binding IclR family transcriptional regulator
MKYQAPALSRGLEILEVLSSKQEALTLNQIASELNVSTSQIFRLLYVLVESGYINKQGSDMFEISGKLFSLGIQYITNYSFLDVVFPILKEISSKTNQSCHCAIKVDDKMVVIARADSPSRFGFSVKVGYSKDIEDSSSGKIILANLPKEELILCLNKIEKKYDKNFVEKLHRNLELIKKQNYTIITSTYVKGIKDIAVPVVPQNSHVGPFSIVIPFVSSSDNKCTLKFALKTLQEGSQKISKMMV